MTLLLCYCECFELCVTSVTAVTRHNIFVFPPRKYIVHQMAKKQVKQVYSPRKRGKYFISTGTIYSKKHMLGMNIQGYIFY